MHSNQSQFSLFNNTFVFQDKRLKMYVKMYSENWELIAAQFSDRSDVQCQQRWTKVVNPELVKGPWTKEVGILINLFMDRLGLG